MQKTPDLSKVKRGDALAMVMKHGLGRATTSVKVLVTKKNPKSVVFEHNGKEYKVDFEGRGLVSGWVEVWDDEVKAKRTKARDLEKGQEDLQELLRFWGYERVINVLGASDVVREPELFAELKQLRASFEAKTRELVDQMVRTRPQQGG